MRETGKHSLVALRILHELLIICQSGSQRDWVGLWHLEDTDHSAGQFEHEASTFRYIYSDIVFVLIRQSGSCAARVQLLLDVAVIPS